MGGADAVEAYLSALPEAQKEAMREIRAMLLAAAPDAEETVKYGMPTACLGNVSILYYAAWKTHIGLYQIYRGDAVFETMVALYRDKTDTLRFSNKRPVPFEVVGRVIDHQLTGPGNPSRTPAFGELDQAPGLVPDHFVDPDRRAGIVILKECKDAHSVFDGERGPFELHG